MSQALLKHFAGINAFIYAAALWSKHWYQPHFTDCEMKAQIWNPLSQGQGKHVAGSHNQSLFY